MSFSRLLRFFSDHLSITSSNSSSPKNEESSSNSSAPKKEESSSNSSAPKIMVSTSTSSIALLGVMLMASSTFIYYFYSKASSSNSSAPKNEESSSNSSELEKEESSSNSSEPKIMVSTSTSYIQKRFKYDVFLSFRGEDTRNNFVGHLYEALKAKGIYTYKDDVRIHKGKTISDELIKAIEDSKFYIIIFSENYASSSWCLDELLKIMECQNMDEHTAYPVFYDVEPTQVRNQSGAVEDAFSKNKEKEAAEKWKGALKEAADLAGWELKNTLDGHEAEFIKKIVKEILLDLRPINSGFDEKLVGMETRVKDVVSSLEMGIDDVRMIGIKGMGGAGKTTTARAVFDHLSADFDAKSFVENVREVSKPSMSGLKKLQKQVLSDVLKENVNVNAVTDGINMMQERMRGIKVLLVLDDVDHIEQLEALAGRPNWFKPGSRIIVTTRNEQVLEAHRVKIRDIDLLSDKEAICLLNRYAFGRENPPQRYKELSGKVVRYAAGLPLTVKVLGSFLCGKDEHEWKDAMERLKEIPLKETQEKLELSYTSLENDYKEIFLDIACILKGLDREEAIRILECCGFHARNGLKVLEQRSLITVDKYGDLGMHDHLEEMGKNIVRREHPNEPKKHSRLWIKEEIEDILTDDKGTEATMCLELPELNTNAGTVMKGLGKMKKLRYLNVHFPLRNYYHRDAGCLDDTSQYFSNSLKYLNCRNYPFLYLPKTFQANNLVGLEIYRSKMVELWEEGEKKVLKKLKFLSLYGSALTIFDFRITPILETLYLKESPNLVELFMPVSCQNLNNVHISRSKLKTFDLGLTLNLKELSLDNCADFEALQVSSACPNLKILQLCQSRLSSLDLELFPNLERLNLKGCDKLVEINAPVGCLRKLVYLDLTSCLRFPYFVVPVRGLEPKDSRSSASLHLDGESLDLCPLHPNSILPKFQFDCTYEENLLSSVGNIEKLISFGLCACTDFKKFSDMIFSLRCLRKLELKCDIPEIPKDLSKLECLEELCLSSTKIKHLPDSICMLKCLISLKVDDGDLLEKLPENLGQLECLEMLYVRSKKIEFLPDSICMLKRLKTLAVRDCSCLGKLPKDIGQLESLESLDLSATKIKHLPDSICMLKHLTYLYLDDCALWEEGKKMDLKQLKFVSLSKSALTTFDFSMTPSLETLILSSNELLELCMPVSCQELKHLDISDSKLRTFDLGFTPNLETLSLNDCADFEELHMSSACPNLKFLYLRKSRLSSLDLELFPNLERLYLEGCDKLVEINAPVGCLRKLVHLNLNSCLRFSCFRVPVGGSEPKVSRSLASLCLVGKSLDLCPLHPNSNLPKFQFECTYEENLPSSVGNIEKLISFGLCACTDFKKFSDIICSLRCLRKLKLKCDIPEFPKDLGKLECLEELCLSSTKIKHLPDSICMLKCLKSLKVDNGDLLEKLPENLGQLEFLERLHVRSEKIEYLPDSICMLKRLKTLYLTSCSCLGKLPEDIGQLESLERLDLSATNIKHLPGSICKLKHLRILDLRDCALLEKLPEDIAACPKFNIWR